MTEFEDSGGGVRENNRRALAKATGREVDRESLANPHRALLDLTRRG